MKMGSPVRLARWFVATSFGLTLSAIAYDSDNVRYDWIEQIRTKTDIRQRSVDFEISRGNATYKDRLVYDFRETPRGSIEPKVKAIDFRRDVDLTKTELETLFDRLIRAGIFQLPQSAEHRGEGNIWGLWGSLKGHQLQLSYRQPPRTGVRRKVDDAVTAIIQEFGLNKIDGPCSATIVRKGGVSHLQWPESRNGPNPAITETEGDLVPARPTTLRWLINHTADFDRKRVSVVGFYHNEFEGSELRSSQKSDYSENVWCDSISPFAVKGTAFCQDCWVRLDGVFLKGGLDLWPGALTRVTRVEIQKHPSVATAGTTP